MSEQKVTNKNIIIGQSPEIQNLYGEIEKLAPSQVAIHIHGETGTGKELVAKEIHRHSQRSTGPFIAVNAAALPESLIESELFGHKKGAFTGATNNKAGLIELAHGGTLFIDEIGELPLHLQPKLLRVLQEKSVQRVGEFEQRSVDFRLVTATHKNISEMVEYGEFREDLYYRVVGAEITLAPLRNRGHDIVILSEFFAQKFKNDRTNLNFSNHSMELLVSYDWPGNVRELENVIERASILCDGDSILPCHLALKSDRGRPLDNEFTFSTDNLATAKEQWMRFHLLKVLEKNNWNKKRSAKALGIGLRTLFRYLEQLDIQTAKIA